MKHFKGEYQHSFTDLYSQPGGGRGGFPQEGNQSIL